MKDKSPDILLLLLFGIGGIAILAMTWTRPMPASEWILNTLIGFSGIFWVSLRILLKSMKSATDNRHVSVEADSSDK